jgi:WD40 repeat protein
MSTDDTVVQLHNPVPNVPRRQTCLIGAVVLVTLTALAAMVFGFLSGQNAQVARTAEVQAVMRLATAEAKSTLVVSEANSRAAAAAQAQQTQIAGIVQTATAQRQVEAHPTQAPIPSEVVERPVEAQVRVALSRQLAAASSVQIDKQLDLALLLGGEAFRTAQTADALAALLAAASASQNLYTFARSPMDFVDQVVFSPTGKIMVTAGCAKVKDLYFRECTDERIMVWDVTDPQHILPLSIIPAGTWVTELAFSPDGTHLISRGNDLGLWDMSDPKKPVKIASAQPKDFYGAVAVRPDQKLLASGECNQWEFHGAAEICLEGQIRLWNIADFSQTKPLGLPLVGHKDLVRELAFSSDGKTLASVADDGSILLWDLLDLTHVVTASLPGVDYRNLPAVAFSPDDTLLATVGKGPYGNVLDLWDVSKPQHPEFKRAIYFEEGNEIGHLSGPMQLAFSPDGVTLALSGCGAVGTDNRCVEGKVALWDVDFITNMPERYPSAILRAGNLSGVDSFAFSHDSKTLAAVGCAAQNCVRGQVLLWNVGMDRLNEPAYLAQAIAPEMQFPGQFDRVTSLSLSADSKLLVSTGWPNSFLLWDVSNPNDIGATATRFNLTRYSAIVESAAFNPESKNVVFGGSDGSVTLWDVTNPLHIALLDVPFSGYLSHVNNLAFSPDGQILASAGCSAQASVLLCTQGQIRLWDVSHLQQPIPIGQPLDIYSNRVDKIVFSPDGHTLATSGCDQRNGSDYCMSGKIVLFNVDQLQQGRPISLTIAESTSAVTGLAFSPDGKSLVWGSWDGHLKIWDITNPQRPMWRATITTNGVGVYAVTFNRDGKLLLTGNSDGSLGLWEMLSSNELLPLGSLPVLSRTYGLALSSDGKTLIMGGCNQYRPDCAAGDGGGIVKFDIDPATWTEQICRVVNRNFTQAEWELYFGNEIYRKTCPNLPEGK